MTVQEFGKKPQRCRVLKNWRDRDGLNVFEVQALDTCERMTIVESSPIGEPGGKVQAMTTRIYHWMKDARPTGAPLPPVESMTRHDKSGNEKAHNDKSGSDKSRNDTSSSSDWHLSWGKPEDHKSRQAAAVDLPRADTSKPDPLMDPTKYSPFYAEIAATEKAEAVTRKAETVAQKVETVTRKAETVTQQVETATRKAEAVARKVETIAQKKEPEVARPAAAAGKKPESVERAVKAPVKERDVGMVAEIKRLFAKDEVPEKKVEVKRSGRLGSTSVLAAGSVAARELYVPLPMPAQPAGRPSPPESAAPPASVSPVSAGDVENAFTTAPPPPPPEAPPAANPENVNAFSKPSASRNGNAYATPPQGMMPMGQPLPAGYAPPQRSLPTAWMPAPPAGQVALGYAPPQRPMQQAAWLQPPTGQMTRTALPASPQVGMPQGTPGLPTTDLSQVMLVLRNSLYPSHREWAAEHLASVNWQANPFVVEALMQAAREDPAGSVRAACVRSLSQLNVNTFTVMEALKTMKADQDAQVRQEVDEALARMGAGGQPIQPVGAKR